MDDDIGDLKYFPVSDNFTKSSIENYIKLIDYINKKNSFEFLEIINITNNFVEFIHYLDAEKIMDIISSYLDENSEKYTFLLNDLNYDIKIKIYINFNYKNLLNQLKYEPYF